MLSGQSGNGCPPYVLLDWHRTPSLAKGHLNQGRVGFTSSPENEVEKCVQRTVTTNNVFQLSKVTTSELYINLLVITTSNNLLRQESSLTCIVSVCVLASVDTQHIVSIPPGVVLPGGVRPDRLLAGDQAPSCGSTVATPPVTF